MPVLVSEEVRSASHPPSCEKQRQRTPQTFDSSYCHRDDEIDVREKVGYYFSRRQSIRLTGPSRCLEL